MTGISIRGLVAGYGQDDILRGVDLEVESGSIACVIGPNGAGKSTVLKAISGLVRCRLGSITIGGTAVTGWPPAPCSRWAPCTYRRSAACSR